MMTDATQAPDAAAMDAFVQMSALLTGFAADAIAPSLDPVNLKATLFATARQGGGAAFDALLAQYGELSGGKPVSEMSAAERQSIGEQLLGLAGHEQPEDRVKTAQSILRLWYLGYWYPIDDSDPGGVVASDQAYIRGLSWKAMQSHAMGYSTWSYGYWAAPPPPLSDFTGRSVPAPPAEAAPAAAEPAAALAAAEAPRTAARRAPVNATGQGKGGQSPARLVAGDAPAAEGGVR